MKRTLLTLTAFVALAAWASAQAPTTGPSVAEELKHLRTNRTLLEHLVDHSVKIADADTPLDRADRCRDATASLKRAIQGAGDDPDRVVELIENLVTMIKNGLAPTLARARAEIPHGSQDYERMKQLHVAVRQDLTLVQEAIPTTGKTAKSNHVKDARQQLTVVAASVPVVED